MTPLALSQNLQISKYLNIKLSEYQSVNPAFFSLWCTTLGQGTPQIRHSRGILKIQNVVN